VYFNRTIPLVEVKAISKFLFHLLTGNVNKLPTETLVHKFWTTYDYEQKQATKYLECLRKHHLTSLQCSLNIGTYCGSRFGQKPPERLEKCRQLLAEEINVAAAGVTDRIAQNFHNYHSCFQRCRLRVDAHCTEVLWKMITDRRLRVTKVVRATMDSMRPLLRALPNLRVIHLVRDPRAVALSRIRYDDSARGAYAIQIRKSEPQVVAEASLYCHHVTADIRSRMALESEFPGRILSVRYEDVVANPEQRFRDIYNLVDEPVPKATLEQMVENAQKGQAMKFSTKWKSDLKHEERIMIAQRCAEFFRLLNISAFDT